jgi:hypothetical protein
MNSHRAMHELADRHEQSRAVHKVAMGISMRRTMLELAYPHEHAARDAARPRTVLVERPEPPMSGALARPIGTGIDMNHRFAFSIVSLAIAASFLGCASTSPKSSMNPDDQRVWNLAREQHGVGPLDDRAFEIRLSPAGSDVSQPDVIEFAGGRMHSRGCDDAGFGTSAYTTRAVAGGVEFHVVCKSGSGATNDWRGTVHGDSIEGALTWTPGPGEAPVEHAFSGRATKG